VEIERTCGNCKHRGKSIKSDNYDFDSGEYNFRETGYFQCDLIKHDTRKKFVSGSGAVAVDGSGFYAALCVESDFGCNRFEYK